jgi:hypothetical protein
MLIKETNKIAIERERKKERNGKRTQMIKKYSGKMRGDEVNNLLNAISSPRSKTVDSTKITPTKISKVGYKQPGFHF